MSGRILLSRDGSSFPLSGAWMGWSDGALVLAIADAAEARRFATFAVAHAELMEAGEALAKRIAAILAAPDDTEAA